MNAHFHRNALTLLLLISVATAYYTNTETSNRNRPNSDQGEEKELMIGVVEEICPDDDYELEKMFEGRPKFDTRASSNTPMKYCQLKMSTFKHVRNDSGRYLYYNYDVQDSRNEQIHYDDTDNHWYSRRRNCDKYMYKCSVIPIKK